MVHVFFNPSIWELKASLVYIVSWDIQGYVERRPCLRRGVGGAVGGERESLSEHKEFYLFVYVFTSWKSNSGLTQVFLLLTELSSQPQILSFIAVTSLSIGRCLLGFFVLFCFAPLDFKLC